MCGISGIISKKEDISKHVLQKCNDILKHRGPDANNIWLSKDKKIGFAQTRLSIVDIDPRSNQPLSLDNDDLVIVFNGEIYNYLELKKELETEYLFKTTSDTEVLGRLYQKYGKKLLNKIEGMFAFAIYDKNKNIIFLARDIVGQKPLIYGKMEDQFYFASEIPSLLSMNKKLGQTLDESALRLYMIENFSHIPAPFTIFKNIRKLEPSHYMIVKNGEIIEHDRYYRLIKKQISGSEEQAIFTTINEMKPKDVTWTSFLSGGNDTALICLGLRQKNKKPIEVYTLKIDKNDEDFNRSKYVAKKLELTQHTIHFDENKILKSVQGQVKNLGEPYFHLTSVYADQLLENVSKKHKVIFTGAGGDEVYYGYDNRLFIGVDILLKLNKIVPESVLRFFLPSKYKYLAKANILTIKELQYNENYKEIQPLFQNQSTEVLNYFSSLNKQIINQVEIDRYIDLSYMSGLFIENNHSLTIQSDLIGMKNSIEVRCPFLEKRILERGFSISLIKKINIFNPKKGKLILKKILKKYLSKEFVEGKKIGFGVKYERYETFLKNNEKEIFKKINRLLQRNLFIKEKVIKKISTLSGSKKFSFLMKLYSIECWYKIFEKHNTFKEER